MHQRLLAALEELEASIGIVQRADSEPDTRNYEHRARHVMASLEETLLFELYQQHPALKPTSNE
ncbi:MAG: hypothetical protein GC201_08850 [Alphaproteobacteria bacterium]|nr:hypothetical protein [Alphaproteobacteria bacterium]